MTPKLDSNRAIAALHLSVPQLASVSFAPGPNLTVLQERDAVLQSGITSSPFLEAPPGSKTWMPAVLHAFRYILLIHRIAPSIQAEENRSPLSYAPLSTP